MNEATKYKDAIKASRWSAILTLLGFLIVVAAISYSALELSQLEKRKENLEQEITTKEDTLKLKQMQLDSANKALQYSYNQLAFVIAQLEQKQTDLASELAEKALKESKFSAINARIFIHIQDEVQREKAERIKRDLESKGYIVASKIKTVEVVLSRSQLRFFRRREESEAASIASYLTALKSEDLDVRLNDLSEYYENSARIPPRYYELWLKK